VRPCCKGTALRGGVDGRQDEEHELQLSQIANSVR